MDLNRSNFENIKEKVENEICCSIPIGTKSSKITKVCTDAFKDWKKLEYVYIPSSIEIVEKDAFIWENIKIIFANLQKTKIIDLPKHVKVLPILGNEMALFEILNEVMMFKKRLSFNPETIENTNHKLETLTTEFISQNEKREQDILKKQQEVETILSKLDDYHEKAKSISEEILKSLETSIRASLDNEVEMTKTDFSKYLNQIKELYITLEEIITRGNETRKSLENTEILFNKKVKENEEKIKHALEELTRKLYTYYDQSKQRIINDVIEQATNALVEKNPCKNVIINIVDAKKKFETKDLFHQEFENVLKLVSLKKPVLLKGPAGSGKNVILEQVAKALDLKFYYLNDVTEEYKVMGFVDANGRYQETQFFKAFTNGGLMFIDELDNSSPSALLSINAAIGTGYNHYMAFPDGKFYQANKNFHLVAAANTFGTGADAIYCGRQALDGASLNRFIPITIDYDRTLEKNLVRHKEILNLYWNVRDIVQANTIRHVISTRNIINASDLLDVGTFSLGNIFDWTIIQGLDKTDLNIIASRVNESDYYSSKFTKHLRQKYNVSTRL